MQSSSGDKKANFGGGEAELATKRVTEMTVTGKPQIEGERREIVYTFGQHFQGSPEPQPHQITVQRQSGVFAKHSGKVERGDLHGSGDLV